MGGGATEAASAPIFRTLRGPPSEGYAPTFPLEGGRKRGSTKHAPSLSEPKLIHFQVDISAGHPANVIVPDHALGAGIDGMGKGEVKALFTPWNVRHMRQTGFKRITYRLRTELGGEAWHWSEEGAWSDPARKQGYWVGDPGAKSRPDVTWGYRLPRRGDTIDQANNHGYSRLDDGDPASFWKSNPWLDPHFSHEPDTQWVVVQLDDPGAIDAMHIRWAQPFATHVQVQYWQGEDEYDDHGRWITFPKGEISQDRPGDGVVRLADTPIRTSFLRLLLTGSSHTAPEGSSDIRDTLGFAVRELQAGTLDAKGALHDLLRHGRSAASQSTIWVSSTDPWHRAIDRDPELEQPGLDLVQSSGLAAGAPMMVPVGLLYDNPDNAVAEIEYLRRRGYAFDQVELGEEPDGQYAWPEHYGGLYLQLARRLHALDPNLRLGGPSLQSGFSDPWLASPDRRTWTLRLTDWLAGRGGLKDLQFFTFEHYPFDDLCGGIEGKLRRENRLMADVLAELHAGGVSASTPVMISEYGISAYSGRASAEMPGALINADMVGDVLTRGGQGAYLFGYPPNAPINQRRACAGWGNMMTFQADENGQARWTMPDLWGAAMLTGDWLGEGAKPHEIWPVRSDQPISKDMGPVVSAYGVKRPDGTWGMLLINRDARAERRVELEFPIKGPRSVAQYGPAQFEWHEDRQRSRPLRSDQPVRFTAPAGRPLVLPPYSLTVVTVG